jgi:hypothetical protein
MRYQTTQTVFVAADSSAEYIDYQCFTWLSADKSAATRPLSIFIKNDKK